MQKKIIALAIAGLASTAAFAQSNVTIYGVADVAYLHASGSGAKGVNSIESGGLAGSRIGFKGVEDLGNGLKALFTLEYALAMDDNAALGSADAPWSSTVARQQFVGLTSNYGTLVGGRLQTAGYDWACSVNPLAGGAFATNDKLNGRTLLSCGSTGRANNAVAYISPTFAGVTVALNTARLTESRNNTATNPNGRDSNAYLGSVNYKVAGLNATAIYTRVNANASVAEDDVREWGLGGSYDFQVAKLFASYQNQKAEAAATGKSDKTWQVGVSVPTTATGAVHATYARLKYASTTADDNQSSFSLAYTHGLSKRTKLYAGYNRVSNGDTGSRSVTNNAVAPAAPTYADGNFVIPSSGGHASIWGVGINHAF
ncbi:porin [Dechloromonas sp. XY25]|uniref:Porin n=1 Tax=Dechloromonas hankyongensis TaxID=2908002 RepID=A0ABS9K053_9RHOO|nr:porin [Dechloromonas hankyongensis]MCG2576545.1 porin [Dechloromonas hankyongensis]